MNQSMTNDSLATVLLTTGLALPRSSDLRPFAAREWATIVRALVAIEATPQRLLNSSSDDLVRDLNLDQPVAERIVRLLDRAGLAAIELQRLADLGIWCLTKLDDAYPTRLKQRLPSTQSPSVLFGAGPRDLMARDGVAIVGSRNVAEAGLQFADQLGRRCADDGLNAVSGAARGVDRAAMMGALDSGGTAIGVLADSLEKSIRARDVRQYLLDGQLVVVSSALPKDGFAVGRAMERNKYIYCLAEYAIVVATDVETGGTWAGAVENLRNDWVPLFVRAEPGSPPGNEKLLSGQSKGTRPPSPIVAVPGRHELADWLRSNVRGAPVTLGLPWDTPPTSSPERSVASIVEEDKPTYNVEAAAQKPEVPDAEATVRVDFFEVCWPHLGRLLQSPRSEAEILSTSELLTKAQLKLWLETGLERGKLVRQGRPARYSLAGEKASEHGSSKPEEQLSWSTSG